MPKHRQDKVDSGPASSGSSTCGETLDFDDNPNLSYLVAVVGDPTRHAAHCTSTSHLSANWIQQINNKNLLPSDPRDANVLSCIYRLLLYFYPRINGDEREHVDETVELILGVFAEIQARLEFQPDIAVQVIESVKTHRHLLTVGTGSIKGIPSALNELAALISRVQEKFTEEAIRTIQKAGQKVAKNAEHDVESEIERKHFKTQLNDMKCENERLLLICQYKGVDTRTKRQKDAAKELQQDEHQRSGTQSADRQRSTTSRSSRSDEARKPDNGDGTMHDEVNDLATEI